MIKMFVKVAAALSLMLSASIAAPAWSADKSSAKCHHSKAKQAKRGATAPKPQPARGITLVEHRKQDVQILSFGP